MSTAYSFEGRALTPLDWQAGKTLRWAAWRPDGALALLVGNGGAAFYYDGSRLLPLATGSRHNLRGAAWSPNARTALLVGNRGAVLLLEGEAFAELPAATSENLRRVAWHPSGEYALVVGNAGTVLRYESATRALWPLPGDRAHTLRAVAFPPLGSNADRAAVQPAAALIGAYASRWAGYPRPHALYRCDGRYLQSLLATNDEDDLLAVDWREDGTALVAGYATRPDGSRVNKTLFYDGSAWRTFAWSDERAVLGGGWRPGSKDALLVGEGGLLLRLDESGRSAALDSGCADNLIGPFWRPDGTSALVLRGPGDRVYTV